MKVLVVLVVIVGFWSTVMAEDVLFREEFDDLDAWTPVTFDGIDSHTRYRIIERRGNRHLQVEVDASASAMVHEREFDVTEFSGLRWRWKVDGVFRDIDETAKTGDDYPIRILVLFTYDANEVGAGTRLKYGFIKALYGDYPPLASLNFVWRSSISGPLYYESPYTDRQVMIVRQAGDMLAGTWLTETADMIREFEHGFDRIPTPAVRIGVMGDGDNTMQEARAWIDFIEVYRP